MKATTRVRIDEFTSTGETCRIVGRKDHVISTERSYRPVVMVREEGDSEDWYLPGFWDRITTERRGHLQVTYDEHRIHNTFSFYFMPFALNRSIEKCLFKPLTSQNHFDTDPRSQVKILPYLCEDGIVANIRSRSIHTGEMTPVDTTIHGKLQPAVDPDHYYSYTPTEDSMFSYRLKPSITLRLLLVNVFYRHRT